MCFKEKYKESDSYAISRITKEEKEDILFLRSALSKLKFLIDLYKTK